MSTRDDRDTVPAPGDPTADGSPPRAPRGFARLSPSERSAISSKGGKAAHAKGTAYEWDYESAAVAGSKGGIESWRRKRAARS